VEVIRDRAAPAGPAQPPLLLLPGAYMRAQDFFTHGFVGAVRRTGQPIDILAVDTGMESYLDGSIVQRLHDEAVAPSLANGARRVWLAGISLGGLGALLYCQARPGLVEGLLLISPFIGTRGTVAELLRAGGFEGWQPPTGEAATREHRLLQWLKTYRSDDPARPDIYLGYGSDDSFVNSYRLLATILPAERVVTAPGGHDWETWKVLWEQLLRKPPFFAETPVRQARP
jgi:pimeloyl-ACP methyl ester carboxylesterase